MAVIQRPPGTVAAVEQITVTVRVPAEHLTEEEYLLRIDPLMAALVALESANSLHFADPGVGAQGGPTPADRLVEIEAQVQPSPGYVWARVLALPGCFPTGSTVDDICAVLAEVVTRWMVGEPGVGVAAQG